ncbi:hypothetical protein BDY21DRAFT_81484 [Lineolata rhizophorae]|uniref:Uncharacterized protein n=1 Tax=Lineolata rhizophorae TaxID=578093 RepID=A0A6A6PBB2_9PEZI|nr:hypothetical protein BDY21DRAFT_81484 [Lineolata rhizophorae]
MDSPGILVARFLKANGYDDTFAAFIKEAGLPASAGTISKNDVTIEQVLREKQMYDKALSYEKAGGGKDKGWHHPYPSVPMVLGNLPTSTNILHVSVENICPAGQSAAVPVLLATTADRKLHMLRPTSSPGGLLEVHRSLATLQDSPILSYATIGERYLINTSMSGKMVLYDCKGEAILDSRKDHLKYVVDVVAWQSKGCTWVATAGWDSKVLLYRVDPSTEKIRLGDPVARVVLPTIPESILFVRHPDNGSPVLVVARRDSSFLFYYRIPDLDGDSASVSELELLGRQNLAPHSNAWVAFTPAAMRLSPIDPLVVAVATSAVPHMKLIIVRLLLPPLEAVSTGATGAPLSTSSTLPASLPELADSPPLTQASQARAELALQDREEAAIILNCTTFAPQTPLSTPSLAWRPNGSGVWVNSDDGVIRGIEATSGKVMVKLEGHTPGSKVRCLWAGQVAVAGQAGGTQEWAVSGGFDQKLIVWRSQ